MGRAHEMLDLLPEVLAYNPGATGEGLVSGREIAPFARFAELGNQAMQGGAPAGVQLLLYTATMNHANEHDAARRARWRKVIEALAELIRDDMGRA